MGVGAVNGGDIRAGISLHYGTTTHRRQLAHHLPTLQQVSAPRGPAFPRHAMPYGIKQGGIGTIARFTCCFFCFFLHGRFIFVYQKSMLYTSMTVIPVELELQFRDFEINFLPGASCSVLLFVLFINGLLRAPATVSF